MLYLALGLWILAALITVKLDAAVSSQPTDYKWQFAISLIVWPIVGALLLFTKHEVSPSRTQRY